MWGPRGPSRGPAAGWRLEPSPSSLVYLALRGSVELGDGLLSVHLEFQVRVYSDSDPMDLSRISVFLFREGVGRSQ